MNGLEGKIVSGRTCFITRFRGIPLTKAGYTNAHILVFGVLDNLRYILCRIWYTCDCRSISDGSTMVFELEVLE